MVNVNDVFIDYFIYKAYTSKKFNGYLDEVSPFDEVDDFLASDELTTDNIRDAISTLRGN